MIQPFYKFYSVKCQSILLIMGNSNLIKILSNARQCYSNATGVYSSSGKPLVINGLYYCDTICIAYKSQTFAIFQKGKLLNYTLCQAYFYIGFRSVERKTKQQSNWCMQVHSRVHGIYWNLSSTPGVYILTVAFIPDNFICHCATFAFNWFNNEKSHHFA